MGIILDFFRYCVDINIQTKLTECFWYVTIRVLKFSTRLAQDGIYAMSDRGNFFILSECYVFFFFNSRSLNGNCMRFFALFSIFEIYLQTKI